MWNHKWGISAFCFTRKFFCYRNPQITDGQLNIPKMGFHNQSSVKSFRVISSTVYFFTIFCFELDLTRGQEVGRISYRKVSLHKHKYYPREVQSNCISLLSLQFIILHCPSLSVSHSFNFPNHFPYPSLSYTHSHLIWFIGVCVSASSPPWLFPLTTLPGFALCFYCKSHFFSFLFIISIPSIWTVWRFALQSAVRFEVTSNLKLPEAKKEQPLHLISMREQSEHCPTRQRPKF